MIALNLAKSVKTFSEGQGYSQVCVFISHKKEDQAAAEAVGDYLLNEVKVNIYLDTHDADLKEAVSVENDKAIVQLIQKGLILSTHLLCLVSDKTRLSWWVPYEIGIADTSSSALGKIKISTLKLKGTEDIPSFLKVHDVLWSYADFKKYADNMRYCDGYRALGEHVIVKDSVNNLKKFLD